MKKMWNDRENQLIAAAWTLVYAAVPLYMWYAALVNDLGFRWSMVFETWAMVSAFFVLFLANHFLLIPRLFLRRRYIAYTVATGIVISIFTGIIVAHEPDFSERRRKHLVHNEAMPMHHAPDREKHEPRHPHRKMLAPPDVARLVIALLMIGMDLGGVAWINSQKLRRRLLLLERQNLEQELQHLRYQINPHFFMNTLNNIHVLVDVDQERAKRAIIELSGLMRHSLYNGSATLTALQNEIEFLRQYISLMQLRFGNKVELNTELPDAPSRDIMIPPLLFATFVENAFKHGISYLTPSFINIRMSVDTTANIISFRCENSRTTPVSTTNDGNHGIGLNNVRKRLDLQYGDAYALIIDKSDPQRFIVNLSIPTRSTETPTHL